MRFVKHNISFLGQAGDSGWHCIIRCREWLATWNADIFPKPEAGDEQRIRKFIRFACLCVILPVCRHSDPSISLHLQYTISPQISGSPCVFLGPSSCSLFLPELPSNSLHGRMLVDWSGDMMFVISFTSLKYKDKKWYKAGGGPGTRTAECPQPEPISKILNEVWLSPSPFLAAWRPT